MNDLQIEYFLSAAETLSFTKTANEKFVSQPAVSKQISAMEEELGVALFERGHKSTRLTPAGRMYLEYFNKQMEDREKLHQKLRESVEDAALTLRFGYGHGWNMVDIIPKVIDKVKENYGHAQIWVENCPFNMVPAYVYDNKIDIGLTLGCDAAVMPTLEISSLIEVPRVLLYSKKHPLAENENLQITDFKDEWFFLPQTNRAAYVADLVYSFCESYGFKPKLRVASNVESVLSSVMNGLGVAVTDSWTYPSVANYCKYMELNSKHTIAAIWRKTSANPLIGDFLKALRETI